MDTKAEVKKVIKDFRAVLTPIISRLYGRDKCTARENLSKMDSDLLNLDLFFERPLWTLYIESMVRMKKITYGLGRMKLVTKDEKDKIVTCYEALVETSITYFRAEKADAKF